MHFQPKLFVLLYFSFASLASAGLLTPDRLLNRDDASDNYCNPPNKTPCPTNVPLQFGLILFPSFQQLDVFGPMDALNILAQQLPLNLSILASNLSSVSNRPLHPAMLLPGDNLRFEQRVLPTHTFSNPPDNLDVLIVPGGLGTRNPNTMPEVIDFIRNYAPKTKYLLSICTGSGILARAGVLNGYKATTNKAAWLEVTPFSNQTHWIKKARWVEDRNVWTSAGVSAGIDMILAWMDKVYGERPVIDEQVPDASSNLYGEFVGRRMEYNRERDWRHDIFADIYPGEDVLPEGQGTEDGKPKKEKKPKKENAKPKWGEGSNYI
ncbi:class I glutamine amidotransferase-like protein [Ascobolus immersus RN42]|uniref:Class I glutamine amidotransferase-like protein n=1 Tax=Ascobolus immersus RN42 TaxID=1160509 RepID=A0A3N4ISD0_ASCIM|nr:class I glutamine amidotransferase-like protein [Ascobolus immersus RN42]